MLQSSSKDVIDTSSYGFVDFGCSNGGSLKLYQRLFGEKGIGVDIDPEKVNKARSMRFSAIVADAKTVEFTNPVRFASMHHFLEHIPNVRDVRKIIQNVASNVSEFIIIRQPYFDSDPYLFSHGLKLYWSDWSGHPNNMTMLELHNILNPMLLSNQIKAFELWAVDAIKDSRDTAIHCLDSKINQHEWEPGLHTKKEYVTFDFPVFRETVALIDINGKSLKKLRRKLLPGKLRGCKSRLLYSSHQ